MNEKWYEDIMVQKFYNDTFFDPTKILILLSFVDGGTLKKEYSINEISTVVYRYYICNPKLAKRNISIIIRSVYNYCVDDVSAIVANALKQWIREQKNKSICFLNDTIYLNIDSYDLQTLQFTKTLAFTLFEKYYKEKISPIVPIDYVGLLDDKDLSIFGKCALRQRVFEDYHYCSLCDNTDTDKLDVIHIYSKEDGAQDDMLIDKNNALLLCDDEAEDYIKGKFYFDELGKALNINSVFVKRGMRISMKLLNVDRQRYIVLHMKALRLKGDIK